MVPSWELTYLPTILKMMNDFAFRQVGCVSSPQHVPFSIAELEDVIPLWSSDFGMHKYYVRIDRVSAVTRKSLDPFFVDCTSEICSEKILDSWC